MFALAPRSAARRGWGEGRPPRHGREKAPRHRSGVVSCPTWPSCGVRSGCSTRPWSTWGSWWGRRCFSPRGTWRGRCRIRGGSSAVWVVAAVFSLAGALTIAELGAALPQAGGLTVLPQERPSARPGASCTAGRSSRSSRPPPSPRWAVAFATYCGHFLRLSPLGVQLLAAAIVARAERAQRPRRAGRRRHPEPLHRGQAGGDAGSGRPGLRGQRRILVASGGARRRGRRGR